MKSEDSIIFCLSVECICFLKVREVHLSPKPYQAHVLATVAEAELLLETSKNGDETAAPEQASIYYDYIHRSYLFKPCMSAL